MGKDENEGIRGMSVLRPLRWVKGRSIGKGGQPLIGMSGGDQKINPCMYRKVQTFSRRP